MAGTAFCRSAVAADRAACTPVSFATGRTPGRACASCRGTRTTL
ncbi:Hypothetical protein I596_3641 [Dokdonella koreensis DS-123]|uniref:Uncharacterized protein n=1 Tax=Dokdonella koreensis DS-123 TaxID=1300342 RepID=A0A160DXZ0_9GAMM|nr:Hypothetical protein I596_3641 [Dokdonella koreensis DS-123]